jgi:hypothetical protein|tara:strand:+ start:1551 stop:1655 length:105 start_codon:yes stop_codon:yes gene_type:complete
MTTFEIIFFVVHMILYGALFTYVIKRDLNKKNKL